MTDIRCHKLNLTRPTVLAPEVSGGFGRTLIRLPAVLIDTLLLWRKRAAERAHLAALDDRLLRDVGVSRADVEREASIPFWRES